jgi:hypothetical protein
MWLIMGVSYTASGLHKLQCESWLNGDALYYVLSGPLARQDNLIVSSILQNPGIIQLMTWSSLFLEISFLFLGTFYRTRKLYWTMFMGFHAGILFTVNFSDLTLGMIMAHLFTFDVTWFKFTKQLFEKYDRNGRKVQEVATRSVKKIAKKKAAKSIETVSKITSELKDELKDGSLYDKMMAMFDFGKISMTTWIFYAICWFWCFAS